MNHIEQLALRKFLNAIRLTTIQSSGGRRIAGIAEAKILSAATDELKNACNGTRDQSIAELVDEIVAIPECEKPRPNGWPFRWRPNETIPNLLIERLETAITERKP